MAEKSVCVVEGCGKPTRSGVSPFCNNHYYRNLRHGSPTGGRASPGEPQAWIVSHKDHDGDACLPWPFCKGSQGYGLIMRDGTMHNAHRVMCEEAKGPPPSPDHDAAHSCGNGHDGCINPAHLSWKTARENCLDKLTHGTMAAGERNGNRRLSEAEVRQIRLSEGRHRDIASEFGVAQSTVSRIKRGAAWAHLDRP